VTRETLKLSRYDNDKNLRSDFGGCGLIFYCGFQVCLHSVQKLITGGHVDVKGARSIVETAVGLLEAGLEEIKVLQTVTLLLTTNAVVRGALLAQALVLCFRLYASKDTMTSHAAGATVRQLVSLVFERLESNGQEGKDDAYGLLTDLILLVNGEEAVWLTGVRDLPRPFGLELLESILARFPSVFQKVRQVIPVCTYTCKRGE